jgi:zinc protease
MSPVVAAGLSPVRHALGNGAVLITEHTTTHPAVTIYATLDAGNLYDPDTALGLANFVARVIDRGTESRSSDDIADALDGRGVSLTTSVTRHLLSVSCTCLSEDVGAVMELVADIIRHPSFPTDQVEKRRTAIITGLRQDQDNPAVVATEGLMSQLYPEVIRTDDRGGAPSLPSKASAGTLSSSSTSVMPDRRACGWSSSATWMGDAYAIS